MAIPGIGLPSSYQLARPAAEQNNAAKGGSNNRLSRDASAEQSSNTIATSDKTANSKNALLAPIEQSIATTETTTSRKSLTEIETARRQFQLQSDKNNQNGPTGKALQSFLEVADFERKDEMNTMLGIDIFI
ncbi:MAG: hypothetical protein GY781_10490 [Gammaproteobacteria bacterium]|nr:hypothetical protein [Gammaproteobacteria bacterium]